MARLRAVVVEDSATQSRALARMLEADGDIEVVAIAEDAVTAVDEVRRRRPDVVTMDLEIPGGGGHRAIEQIMADAAVPILVLSGIIDSGGAQPAVRAIAAGAVDALPKPRVWGEREAAELRRQVRRLAGVGVIARKPAGAVAPAPGVARRGPARPVVGLAASTGGPVALSAVLRELAGVPAPLLVVQHINESFAPGFATWLAGLTGGRASIAVDGQVPRPGCIHVAPGDQHMRLDASGRIELGAQPAAVHRPSADELFLSLARNAGAGAIAVVLTGMGDDGAAGAAAVQAAGGAVIVQDEATSVVWGMPRAALERAGAGRAYPLDDIPAAVRAALKERNR